jgi:hypothetical protein
VRVSSGTRGVVGGSGDRFVGEGARGRGVAADGMLERGTGIFGGFIGGVKPGGGVMTGSGNVFGSAATGCGYGSG